MKPGMLVLRSIHSFILKAYQRVVNMVKANKIAFGKKSEEPYQLCE